MAEYVVWTTDKPHMWRDPNTSEPLWYLSVPSAAGVMTVARHHREGFTQHQQHLVQRLANALEVLLIRYRDLHTLEMERVQARQEEFSQVQCILRKPVKEQELCNAVRQVLDAS